MLTSYFWRKITDWASKRTDLVLSDPKKGLNNSPALKATIQHDFSFEGIPYRVSLSNRKEFKRWCALNTSAKEPYTIEWIKGFTDGFFYDVGANIGNYTVLCGLLHPEMKIFSFEPEPNSFVQLCRNIQLNKLAATPYAIAISDKVAVESFHINLAFEAGLSNHQFNRTENNRGEKTVFASRVGMASFSLDALIEEFHFPEPTYLKVDVDGAELNVIHGMKKTLNKGGLQSVMIEIAGTAAEISAATDIFQKAGYVCEKKYPMKVGQVYFFRRG